MTSAASPVISKIFEHAVLVRFTDYFSTSDHQFGFKKKLSCCRFTVCVLMSLIDMLIMDQMLIFVQLICQKLLTEFLHCL